MFYGYVCVFVFKVQVVKRSRQTTERKMKMISGKESLNLEQSIGMSVACSMH